MKLKYPYGIKSSPGFGNIYTVKLLLKVNSPEGLAPIIFLFDTGADVTSLPASAAEKLGIDLDKCPQDSMVGYEGTPVLVYKSQIKINFNNKELIVPCVFNPNEDVPILLGRVGIIDRFNIILDSKNKEITLEET